MTSSFSLHQLGWRACYSQQLSLADLESAVPARITRVERSLITAAAESGPIKIEAPHRPIAVGDWALVERESSRVTRLLERHTVLSRIAAGSHADEQLIAANIDTAFVVSSCNAEFKLSRLERYLAVIREGRIEPVVVLTKTDLTNHHEELVEQVRRIAPEIALVTLDARDHSQARTLLAWLTEGRTGAFIGSSGVGKSTLINALAAANATTAAIRESDAKGRHTTTSRRMLPVPTGGWIIDTPGMRELNVGGASVGVRAAFDDIETLAGRCRFRDCSHVSNAGCAVLAAIEAGDLPARRLENYLKLRREAVRITQSEHERRAASRRFGKLYKAVKSQHRSDGKR